MKKLKFVVANSGKRLYDSVYESDNAMGCEDKLSWCFQGLSWNEGGITLAGN